MRLLHAASSYPLEPKGTTAPFMEEMLSALANLGNDVTVVVPRVRGLIEGRRENVNVVGAPYAPPFAQIWGYGQSLGSGNRLRLGAIALTPIAVLSMARSMRRILTSQPIDVVHLHWAMPQGLLALAVPSGVPIVVSLHGADARLISGWLRPVIRWVLLRADAVIAASRPILAAASALDARIEAKTVVIPHGAKDTLSSGKSRSDTDVPWRLDPGIQAVVAIGRLVRKKGFDRLIQSLPYIQGDLHVFIGGDGPERQGLMRSIPPGFRDRVHLLGHLSRDEVAAWLAAADVVVVPSIPDGSDVDSGPVVLVEALAAGRPVVAGRVGMAPDLIVNGLNGYLVNAHDPREIADGIRRAMNEADRLGAGARRTYEQLGDWTRVAGSLKEVYDHARARRSRPVAGRP